MNGGHFDRIDGLVGAVLAVAAVVPGAALVRHDDGGSSCAGISVVAELEAAPPGAADDLRWALGEASAETGLPFTLDIVGRADASVVVVTTVWPGSGPAAYGDDEVELGRADEGRDEGRFGGTIHLNADALAVGEATTPSYRQVLVHELGHLLGLGHSDDPTSIMYPEVVDQAPAWDAAALAALDLPADCTW